MRNFTRNSNIQWLDFSCEYLLWARWLQKLIWGIQKYVQELDDIIFLQMYTWLLAGCMFCSYCFLFLESLVFTSSHIYISLVPNISLPKICHFMVHSNKEDLGVKMITMAQRSKMQWISSIRETYVCFSSSYILGCCHSVALNSLIIFVTIKYWS